MTIGASAKLQAHAESAGLDPPGPRGLPIIGCARQLLDNPMEFLTKVARSYGHIARIPVRGQYLYLISGSEQVHELLITHRHRYMKNVRYSQIQALLGQGLLLSEAEQWRRQRLITQPAFKPGAVNVQIGWKSEMIGRQFDRWAARAASGAIFDVEPEFIELAQLLAARALLGTGFAKIAARFCAAATQVKQSWPKPRRSVWRLLKPAPSGPQPEFDGALAELDRCLYEYIETHRARGFEDCAILELLAKSSGAEGAPFTDLELRDQLLTLFFAGHETTATALCWIHYLLSRHPEVHERLTREVESVLAGSDPTAGALDQLVYTDQVVQESLRLYSPIHSISRVSLVDHTLGGYRIPKGATVCVSMYATHHLPEYWPDPERFDPMRFTADQCATRPRFAYLPFAAGHRNCIGGGQATQDLKLIVAMLARRYRLELAPGQRIEPMPGTTMYPRHGIRMTLRSRAAHT
ncbi:MAG: cytochrome P450 [Gammaproteobacteria bacterium]